MTTKEILTKWCSSLDRPETVAEFQIIEAMKEFANYHVHEALLAASGEAPLEYTEGIINCYSTENIK